MVGVRRLICALSRVDDTCGSTTIELDGPAVDSTSAEFAWDSFSKMGWTVAGIAPQAATRRDKRISGLNFRMTGVYPSSLENYVFGNTTAASNQGVGIRDPAKNETPSQGKPDY